MHFERVVHRRILIFSTRKLLD